MKKYLFNLILILVFSISLQAEINISGYGNAHYMNMSGMPRFLSSNPNISQLQLREFSLFLDSAINDKLTASLELELSGDGIVTANYAYLLYDYSDEIKLKVGKILIPYLKYNENKPSFRQHLMSSPFTATQIAPIAGNPQNFHGYGWAEPGVSLSYTKSFDASILKFTAVISNGISSETEVLDDNTEILDGGTGMAAYPTVRIRDGIGNDKDSHIDNNNNKAITFSINYLLTDYNLELGSSYYTAKWDELAKDKFTLQGIYFKYILNGLEINGEYSWAKVEQSGTWQGTTNMTGSNQSTGDYNMKGYYIETFYKLFKFEESKWLGIILRYDDVNTNDKAAFNPWDRKRLTAGIEYQFDANARFRYEFNQMKLDDYSNAPTPFIEAGGKEKPTMHMASVIFWF